MIISPSFKFLIKRRYRKRYTIRVSRSVVEEKLKVLERDLVQI